ncbi:MAG TPA: peptidylprolyl isomerase [Candidatus Marinimicrobia bacterium]|nr:peptidylprolyl isomerase [Candidatus Neomarinimicrobiota bacterium]HQE95638.1 peptidylprolyl isomerase [Candidatus Neomarinimicrobiota bacterium]HQK12013.1 peptidylprolyl isomerase [Candidatus Neomarinimicrobiota bacterium]
MKFIVFILIALMASALSAQPLKDADIIAIQKKVQALPDEPVNPNEVVVIETDYGKIVIELFANQAPLHAMNFKKLVKAGYYTGTTFHRVIPDFVIQGGDILSRDANPSNDGTGGPGYTIPAEIGQKHLRGSLAAARLPDQVNPQKASSGSQFYICVKDLPSLDRGGYTVFGRVIEGMNVVDKIVAVPRDQRDRPLKDVVMKSVYITDKKSLKK